MKRAAFLMLAAAASVALAQTRASRVDVTSQPEGATVVVDGRDRGVTPVALFDLAPGRHHLKYRLSGYVERDRFFEVAEGQSVQRNVVMEPEKGILLLKSQPAGCNISIDGASFGATPRLITTLDVKDVHKVVLRKAGYRTQEFTVRFNGREPVVRNEELILDSGIVDVQTEPPGAEVTVNGISRGNSPVVVGGIPKGRATVKLRLDGFKDEVRELSMNAGDRQVLSVVMQGLPGTLSLVSVPQGARFYLNEDFRGMSPVTIQGLPPGTYGVRAELDGYASEVRSVRIGNGAAVSEEFRMRNVMGKLEVRTAPAGATIYLDGRIVGTTKSTDPNAEVSDALFVDNVKEGEHTLVAKAQGYSDVVRHPAVRNSSTSLITLKMKRVFLPDIEIVTDQGAYRGVLVSNTPDFVTIEITLGIQRSFPRTSIRKMTPISPALK